MDLETDVTVIGDGVAGLAAAVAAAEKGSRVLVLEKRCTLGGWEKVVTEWHVGGMTIALTGGRMAGENAALYWSVQ